MKAINYTIFNKKNNAKQIDAFLATGHCQGHFSFSQWNSMIQENTKL